jgi:hypothetical protein
MGHLTHGAKCRTTNHYHCQNNSRLSLSPVLSELAGVGVGLRRKKGEKHLRVYKLLLEMDKCRKYHELLG